MRTLLLLLMVIVFFRRGFVGELSALFKFLKRRSGRPVEQAPVSAPAVH